MQELDEGLLQAREIVLVGIHVVGVDVGHHCDHRLQVQEARVRFVGLDDDEFAGAELGVRAGRVQPAADHEGRIETALGQYARD